MRKFIKFILIMIVWIFTLNSYKIISFNNGFKIMTVENSTSFSSVLNDIINLEKISYYNFMGSGYVIAIETKDKIIIGTLNQKELDALKLLDTIKLINIRKITPFPWWLSLIIMIIIMAFPYPKNKNKKETGVPNPFYYKNFLTDEKQTTEEPLTKEEQKKVDDYIQFLKSQKK